MDKFEKTQDTPLKAIFSSPIQSKKKKGERDSEFFLERVNDQVLQMTRFPKRRDSQSLKGMSMPYLGVGGYRNDGGKVSLAQQFALPLRRYAQEVLPVYSYAGQRSALTTPWNRVNRTGAAESFACLDWEASNDVCERISSEAPCILRAFEVEAASTTGAECGKRDKASAFAAVVLW